MKKFISLLSQDFLVAYRNGHILVIGILLGVMVALAWFLPEDFEVESSQLYHDSSGSKVLEQFWLESGVSENAVFESEDALVTALEAEQSGVGIVFQGELDDPSFKTISRGNVPEQNLNLLDAVLDYTVALLKQEAQPQNYSVETLREQSEPIPANLSGIPIFILSEPLMLGFLLVAVLIFQEKQEGIVKAYRVSPSGTVAYILSKTLLFTGMGTIYAALIVILRLGFSASFWNVIFIVALGSALMTLLGMFVAVFYNNLSDWFFVGVGVLIVFILPMISYAIPVFAPAYITYIPSYPMLFGMREALFPTGKTGFFEPIYITLIAETIAAFWLAYWAVRRKLMTEGN